MSNAYTVDDCRTVLLFELITKLGKNSVCGGDRWWVKMIDRTIDTARAEAQAEIADLQSQLAAKELALRKYGKHDPECYQELQCEPVGCDCGLTDARGPDGALMEPCANHDPMNSDHIDKAALQDELAALRNENARLKDACDDWSKDYHCETQGLRDLLRDANDQIAELRKDRARLDVRDPLPKFMAVMESELKKNDHKGGWDRDDLEFLLSELRNHVEALGRHVAIDIVEPYRMHAKITDDAADVANFAMMIWDCVRYRDAAMQQEDGDE